MKKRILLLITLVLGACLLLVACGGGFDDDDDWKTVRIEQLRIKSTTYELGREISVSVTSTPVDFNLDHEGGEWDYKRLSGYVYFTEQDKLVKAPEGGSAYASLFGFRLAPEVLTTEDIIVYAAYCTHETPHEGFEGDLVSEGVRVKCQTPVVTTAEEFIKYVTEKDGSHSKTFALGADIDLGGMEWTPVDYTDATIWGMGHTVSNFKITATGAQNVGLFSTLAGTVRDLNITDATVTARGEGQNVGILAGVVKHENEYHNTGITRIVNVTVNGEVSAPYYENVGGVVGCSEGVPFNNCTNYAVVNGKTSVGGLCGKATLNNYENKQISAGESFVSCINFGNVSGNTNVGGLIGYLSTSAASVTVAKCTSTGEVVGTSGVGGVFGKVQGVATLAEIRNSATVVGGMMGEKTGGIVGDADGLQSINYCENQGDVTGGKYVGGIVGYAPNATLRADGMPNDNAVTGISYVGGLAGYVGVVHSATNNATVTTVGIAEDGWAVLGGIAGYCTGLINCTNNADVTATVRGDYVGGLAGLLYLAGSDKCNGNKNNGLVSGMGTGTGGIAGFMSTASGGDAIYEISDNENNGAVSGVGYVGGLFGEINAQAFISVSLLKNNAEVTATDACAGGIVGRANRLTVISFCENHADITGVSYVGGMVGNANGTHIKMGGVANENKITGLYYVGGIAGLAGVIEDAKNNGEIVVTGIHESGESYVGGIAGHCAGLLNCENNSDITVSGAGNFVGGLAGILSAGTTECLVNCTNNGVVSTEGNLVGGLVGRLTCGTPGTYHMTYVVRGCINRGAVSGNNVVGGIIGCVLGTNKTYRDCPWCGYTTYYWQFEVKLCQNNSEILGNEAVGGIVGTQTLLTNAATLGDTNQTQYGEVLGTAS